MPSIASVLRRNLADLERELAALRGESDAAEEALQELLGFERGNNRGSDPEMRGPLGMLWVEQATALSVEGPMQAVWSCARRRVQVSPSRQILPLQQRSSLLP